MTCLSELLNRLAGHKISVFLDKTGSLRVRLPTDDPMSLPDEAKTLLRELKTRKEQVREWLAHLNSGGDPFVLTDVRKRISGGVDPLDYRFDEEKQQWVYEPGWWQRIPKERLH